MKTKIMIFLLSLCSSPMFAQSWFTTGNTATPTDYLGTNNAQPLNIRTSNIQRMTILANGNVGIGLLTPLSKFHVHDLAVPTWMQVTNDLSGFTMACELVLQPLTTKPKTKATT